MKRKRNQRIKLSRLIPSDGVPLVEYCGVTFDVYQWLIELDWICKRLEIDGSRCEGLGDAVDK